MGAMENVVTGVFVERVQACAQLDKDDHLANDIIAAFKDDVDELGRITAQDFKRRVHCEGILQYFRSIDVDPSDAESLFKIFDAKHEGTVELVDVVSGCLSLRGPAKALSLHMHAREAARVQAWTSERIAAMES